MNDEIAARTHCFCISDRLIEVGLRAFDPPPGLGAVRARWRNPFCLPQLRPVEEIETI